MSFEAALEIHRNEHAQKKNSKISNGFYLQQKRGLEKVFLIIDAGNKCLVMRPNIGAKVMTAHHIIGRIRSGEYEPISDVEASDAWAKEFDLAGMRILLLSVHFTLAHFPIVILSS